MEHLKELIQRLQKEDTKFRVFGSEKHRYNFRPRLSEKDIRLFEKTNRIHLPDDYRWFLLKLGNGGAGPDYGIETIKDAAFERELSIPFPYTNRNSYIGFRLVGKNP